MKMTRKLRIVTLLMTICIFFVLQSLSCEVFAAPIKLNKTTVYLSKGKTYQLKVVGTTAKVKWKSSAPSIVSVSKKGKLTAKNYGSAVITAKVKNLTLKCNVKVERKGEKNARLLREYILKNGKKSGTKRYISKKVHDDEEADGMTRECRITASTKNNSLLFEYSLSTAEPPEYHSLKMKIDLISGSEAVRTGTNEFYYEDGYGDETWERYYADITTLFTHTYDSMGEDTASGITINKLLEHEGECLTERTDPAELNQEKYLRSICVNTTWAFRYWDELMSGHKELKKAKITMKSIGFTKVSY